VKGEMTMKYPTYEELLKEIEKEPDGNGVQCLLESIYGEKKGDILFRVWLTNEAKFKRLIEEEAE